MHQSYLPEGFLSLAGVFAGDFASLDFVSPPEVPLLGVPLPESFFAAAL
jgi:hypothetical protein